jgi:microcystin-dependent protein
MAQPYVGEIRMFGGNFAPVGWMFCEGQQLPISENETLFQLIGTTYGGDGQETFNLPDLQGRVPVHMGQTIEIAEKAGVESVTLTTQQIPIHTHPFTGAATPGTEGNPQNNLIANSTAIEALVNLPPDSNMNAQCISPAGGSQPHENLQPYLCISFIISLFGIFPQQT